MISINDRCFNNLINIGGARQQPPSTSVPQLATSSSQELLAPFRDADSLREFMRAKKKRGFKIRNFETGEEQYFSLVILKLNDIPVEEKTRIFQLCAINGLPLYDNKYQIMSPINTSPQLEVVSNNPYLFAINKILTLGNNEVEINKYKDLLVQLFESCKDLKTPTDCLFYLYNVYYTLFFLNEDRGLPLPLTELFKEVVNLTVSPNIHRNVIECLTKYNNYAMLLDDLNTETLLDKPAIRDLGIEIDVKIDCLLLEIYKFINFATGDLSIKFFISFFSKKFMQGWGKALTDPAYIPRFTNVFRYIIDISLGVHSVNFLRSTDDGTTVLHCILQGLIMQRGGYDISSILTDLKRLIDAYDPTILSSQDDKGTTVLHNCLFLPYPVEVLEMLLTRSPVLISISDDKLKYPIFYACEFKSPIVQFSLILSKSTDEQCKALTNTHKSCLEYLFKNYKQIRYSKENIARFISNNNQLAFVSSVDDYLWLESNELYREAMRYAGKSLIEIIYYKLHKLRQQRPPVNTTQLATLAEQLGMDVGRVPVRYNDRGIEIDKDNSNGYIKQYINAILAMQREGRGSLTYRDVQFRFTGERGVDAGGVERTFWNEVIKEFTSDKYFKLINGKLYFKDDLSSEDLIILGNLMGRVYKFQKLSLFTTFVSPLDSIGLFYELRPKISKSLMDAGAVPPEEMVNQKIGSYLFTVNQYMKEAGVKIEDFTVALALEQINYTLMILGDDTDESEPPFKMLKELIIRNEEELTEQFLAFANLLEKNNVRGTGDERFLNIYLKTGLMELSKLKIISESKSIFDLNSNELLDDNMFHIKRHVEKFNSTTRIKLIEGINQVIDGFFEFDRRRIYNSLSAEPIKLTPDRLKSMVRIDYGSLQQQEIMRRVAEKVIDALAKKGELGKFVAYFGGIELILNPAETYTFKLGPGNRISEHTCFYYVDIPINIVRLDNEENLFNQLVEIILSNDNIMNVGG